MSNPLDSDAGTENFDSYDSELRLVLAELNQKNDQISELNGEPRKAAISAAQRAQDEAQELLGQMRMARSTVPSSSRDKVSKRLRNAETDVANASHKLTSLSSSRAALLGSRYTDDPSTDDQLEQRQQLLSGTDRLGRSSQRLKESQRIANETEAIGAGTLADLARQRETITNARDVLLESEGYTDRSIKTLRGMARRMATNRIVTIAIITILVLLILAVIVSKFR